MKILLVNKFYRPNGGAETVFLATKQLLEKEGHEVVPFAMSHEDNLSSEWSTYFTRQRSYTEGRLPARARDALSAVYSMDARRSLRSLLRRFSPDVAHLHNVYHQLSLSVVGELRRAGVPMVMTLHDYKLVCPNYSLFTNGRVCRRCVTGSVWNAVAHRCVKQSIAGSIVAAVEGSIARALDAYGAIDRFVVPSRFLRDLVVESGVREQRLRVVRYPVASEPELVSAPPVRPRFVFFGRFTPEKGMDVLLDASAALRGKADVLLIGRGPSEEALGRRIASERLPVVMHPFIVDRAELRRVLCEATAVVVPSIAYENAPMAILEAAAVGVPAVASEIGGIPEMVDHGVTGVLVPPGDPDALVGALEELAAYPPWAADLGRAAWRRVRALNDPDRYRGNLLRCYAEVARNGVVPVSEAVARADLPDRYPDTTERFADVQGSQTQIGIPRTGSVRTASGPEGSSAKDSLSGAAVSPDPSRRRRHVR